MTKRRMRYGLGIGLALMMSGVATPPSEAEVLSVGLSSVRAQRFGRLEMPNPNPDGGDVLGRAFAAGDFNGDGAEDLATGVPGSDGLSSEPRNSCGAVVVRYGVPGVGLAEGGTPTVLGQFVGPFNFAEANSQFGAALAACDLNGDAYDDLIIGAPFRSVSVSFLTFLNAGIVEVYYGSSAGLAPPASATRRERGQDVNLPTEEAHFGAALACADFDNNGFDDLAVGLPYRSLGTGAEFAGRINVFSGSASGLSTGALAIDQNSPGMLDAPEFIDNFGAVLTAGDFDADGFADLAIGVAAEAHPSAPAVHAGAVQVVYGGAKGLGGGVDQLIFESDFGGFNWENQFGFALVAGDFDIDGDDDLVIGVPGEDLESAASAGAFYAIPGTSSGLALASARLFSEDDFFGNGSSDPNDGFGTALASGDFDGDGASDLAVGVPAKDLFGTDDGFVMVVMGGPGELFRPTTVRRRAIQRGVHGFPGDLSEEFVFFGESLGIGDFDGTGVSDLVVGAPREDENLIANVGTATVLYGALFADGFGNSFTSFWFPVEP